MSSTPDFIEYIAAQISDAGAITYRKMFGEYALYCDAKVVALVCDDQLFISCSSNRLKAADSSSVPLSKPRPTPVPKCTSSSKIPTMAIISASW